MSLENHVVSLELAKKLKELGVKQSSVFEWRLMQCFEAKYAKSETFFHAGHDAYGNRGIFTRAPGHLLSIEPTDRKWVLDNSGNEHIKIMVDAPSIVETVSTFLASELSEILLPHNITLHCNPNPKSYQNYWSAYATIRPDSEWIYAGCNKQVDALAILLTRLIENK